MRKAMKFLHTLAACGLIGAVAGYFIVLTTAPQDTASNYADMRQTISALSNYLLLPSMAVALVTGLLAMVVHRPFQNTRWAWIKALLGLSMFEATLVIVGAKADYAAKISLEIVVGAEKADVLETALTYEWHSLGAIMAISVANIVLGVWRPALKKQRRAQLA